MAREGTKEIADAVIAGDIVTLTALAYKFYFEAERLRERRKTEATRTRLRRSRAAGDVSASMRAMVLERDGFTCCRCGIFPVPGGNVVLCIDHITPVALGGKTTLDNLQTLCDLCNSGKSDRPPHPSEVRDG